MSPFPEVVGDKEDYTVEEGFKISDIFVKQVPAEVPKWKYPMTRSEFIARLADRLGHLSADEIDAAVRSILDQLSLSLQKGERIEIRGFGGFSLRHRPPRVGRNPKTGDVVELPAKFHIHFKPGKALRERVNALPIYRDGTLSITVTL